MFVVFTASLGVVSIPLLLLVEQSFADNPAVNVKEDADRSHEKRPLAKYSVEVQEKTDHNHEGLSGKYLVEICTLSGEKRTVVCSSTPLAAQLESKVPGTLAPDPAVQPRNQTITLKLTCTPAAKSDCAPDYPVVAGSDFFVEGTADSSGVVEQTVRSGPATHVHGSGTDLYHANAPGLIIIRGTLAATTGFASAAPVELFIQVIADRSKAPEACDIRFVRRIRG